jgi:hypothetical protein
MTKAVQIAAGVVVAMTFVGVIAFNATHQTGFEETPNAVPPDAAAAHADLSAAPDAPSQREPLALRQEQAAVDISAKDQGRLEQDHSAPRDSSAAPMPAKRDLKYLAYYVYAEHPPDERPADLVLASLNGVAEGTPIEEIKRACAVFGLDFNFMKAVARIESDFDPKVRTGSYVGLFQLSKYEFNKYGSGDILDARDNAIAAAYKFVTAATQFEWETHKKPTFSDLYLIHQQGWQGAAEHVKSPERIAWKSMCATDEGKEKGEKWCKRAVWQNTLPAIKQVLKSVDHLTSGAFVTMWRQRVDQFYSRYSEATAAEAKH